VSLGFARDDAGCLKPTLAIKQGWYADLQSGQTGIGPNTRHMMKA